MKEACVEEGMKLARWLLVLGQRGSGVASASYEDYQRLSKEAGAALKDVDKMTCLSSNERSVLKSELTYLKEQAEKVNFLYTSDAGSRLLHILSNPQHYLEYYKPEKEVLKLGGKMREIPIEKRAKLSRDDVRVEVWDERDRLHIGIQNKETGDYLMSWWDDEARSMFEQGFFKREPRLEESVLSYAEEMGILQ